MRIIRALLLGAGFLFSAAAAASAADVYQRGGGLKDAPVDYLPAITWTGFYVGGHVGAAFLGLDDSFRAEGSFFSDDDTETGWVAGVGFEYKIRQNVSFGLEGLYYNFDNGDDHLLENGFTFHQDDADFWVVRARLNYHFNSPY